MTTADLERELQHTALKRTNVEDLHHRLRDLMPEVRDLEPKATENIQRVLDLLDTQHKYLDSHADFLRAAIRNERRVVEHREMETHVVAEHGYDAKYAGRIDRGTLVDEHVRLHEDETAKYLRHSHPDNTKARMV